MGKRRDKQQEQKIDGVSFREHVVDGGWIEVDTPQNRQRATTAPAASTTTTATTTTAAEAAQAAQGADDAAQDLEAARYARMQRMRALLRNGLITSSSSDSVAPAASRVRAATDGSAVEASGTQARAAYGWATDRNEEPSAEPAVAQVADNADQEDGNDAEVTSTSTSTTSSP